MAEINQDEKDAIRAPVDAVVRLRPAWVDEFNLLFVTKDKDVDFRLELLDPEYIRDFIRRTIAEVLGEIPDENLRNKLAVKYL